MIDSIRWCGIAAGDNDLYILMTGNNLPVLTDDDGFSFYTERSSLSPSIKIDKLNPIPLIKADGSPYSINNGIINIIYRSGSFRINTVTGSGLGVGTANANHVLQGYTIGTEDGIVPGLIPDIGKQDGILTTNNAIKNISKGYTTGGTIKAIIDNLAKENIASGINVGGIVGTYTDDADAKATDIVTGKIAYAKGKKLIGSYVAPVVVLTGTADPYKVLSPYTFYTNDPDVKQVGLMSPIGAVDFTVTKHNDTITFSEGYTTGGTINTNIGNLSAANIKYNTNVGDIIGAYTDDGTIIASDILINKIGYAKGVRYVGSMFDRGAVTQTLVNNGDSYTITNGYHNGSGKVTVSISNLSAANIKYNVAMGNVTGNFSYTTSPPSTGELLTGRIAFANGAQITGAMPNRGAVSSNLANNGASYTIPWGYHDGGGIITANISNLSAGNIRYDPNVKVGNVAGNFSYSSNPAGVGDVLAGKGFSVNGVSYTGTMPNTGIVIRLTITPTSSYTIKVPKSSIPDPYKIRAMIMVDVLMGLPFLNTYYYYWVTRLSETYWDGAVQKVRFTWYRYHQAPNNIIKQHEWVDSGSDWSLNFGDGALAIGTACVVDVILDP